MATVDVMNESRLLDLASTKKVLFCGESIVDVYHYVRPLGRPTKDAILSVELVSTERFSGGVVAAGAHADPAALCSRGLTQAWARVPSSEFVLAGQFLLHSIGTERDCFDDFLECGGIGVRGNRRQEHDQEFVR